MKNDSRKIPQVGDRVYYYIEDDTGVIESVSETTRAFTTKFTCGFGKGKFEHLKWNSQRNLWEVIRTRVSPDTGDLLLWHYS